MALTVFGEGDRCHRIADCHNSTLRAFAARTPQFAANVLPIIRDIQAASYPSFHVVWRERQTDTS